MTAISKDEEHVFRGYSAGAVDYVFKPFNPDVLRSKVAVFIELHEKTEQLQRQAELLKEQELAELRRESEERYRFLAEAQPDQIWTAMPNGELDYVNQRVLDYFEHAVRRARRAAGWIERSYIPRTFRTRSSPGSTRSRRARRTRTSSASGAPRTSRTAGT